MINLTIVEFSERIFSLIFICKINAVLLFINFRHIASNMHVKIFNFGGIVSAEWISYEFFEYRCLIIFNESPWHIRYLNDQEIYHFFMTDWCTINLFLLQTQVLTEAATTWWNIRRTASTKLALCGTRARSCFPRWDQVSFAWNVN